MKPFLRWVGGKFRNVDKFTRFFPPVSSLFYVEPFVGSGALLFETRPVKALISDVNDHLINSYIVIRDSSSDLVSKLKEHDVNDTEAHYYDVRNDFNDAVRSDVYHYEDGFGDIDQAARFIYLNARCFNGLYRENSKGEYNSPYATGLKGMKRICNRDNINAISRYLNENDIIISCYSYEKSLEQLEHVLNRGEKAFFFLDPPYFPITATASFTGYVGEAWREEEFRKLKTFIDAIDAKGHLFFLCNHAAPFIKDLFSGYRQHEHFISRSVSCKAKSREPVAEIVITNYNVLDITATKL